MYLHRAHHMCVYFLSWAEYKWEMSKRRTKEYNLYRLHVVQLRLQFNTTSKADFDGLFRCTTLYRSGWDNFPWVHTWVHLCMHMYLSRTVFGYKEIWALPWNTVHLLHRGTWRSQMTYTFLKTKKKLHRESSLLSLLKGALITDTNDIWIQLLHTYLELHLMHSNILGAVIT